MRQWNGMVSVRMEKQRWLGSMSHEGRRIDEAMQQVRDGRPGEGEKAVHSDLHKGRSPHPH